MSNEVNGFVSAWTNWFKFDGTRSRASMFLGLFAISIPFSIVTNLLSVAAAPAYYGDDGNPALYVAIIPLVIAHIVGSLAITAQRFRDMGYSGWMSLLTIIPFVTLWPLCARGKGTAESTKGQIYWLRGIIGFYATLIALFFIITIKAMGM